MAPSRRRVVAPLATALSLTAIAAPANSQTVTSFSVDIWIGTDTFETGGGSVFLTEHDIAVSNAIPLDLASQILGDPTFSFSTYVEDNLDSLATAGDYVFLTSVTPATLLTVNGAVDSPITWPSIPGAPPAAMVSDLTGVGFPAGVKQDSTNFVGGDSYLVVGCSIGSPPCVGGSFEVDGIININIYDLNIVEQVPEPATWSLMLAGFAGLGGWLRRGRPTAHEALQRSNC
jgi:hypothetical protein